MEKTKSLLKFFHGPQDFSRDNTFPGTGYVSRYNILQDTSSPYAQAISRCRIFQGISCYFKERFIKAQNKLEKTQKMN